MWMKKEKTSYIIAIISILAIASFLFIGVLKQGKAQVETPSLHQGNLDVSNWNCTQNGLISFSGEWEFYWEKILCHDDLKGEDVKPDLLVRVPDVWNNCQLNGKRLPGYGYATYRLRVENVKEGQSLAIRMPTVSTAYRLYVDNQLIASNRIVGEDQGHYAPEYKPMTAVFTPTAKDFDIILQVANFSSARGGVWYFIPMGTQEAVVNYDRIIIYKDMFLIGAFLIMAVFYFFVYIMNKEDKANLYFVLLCISVLIRVGIYGDYSISRIFPMIHYDMIVKIDYLSIYWIATSYVLLLKEVFPGQKSKKIIDVIVVYAVAMSILTLVSPIIIFTSITYFIEGVAILIFGYAFTCTIIAFYKQISGSSVFVIGSITVLLASIHDVLYENNFIHSKFWGIFILCPSCFAAYSRGFCWRNDIENSLMRHRQQSLHFCKPRLSRTFYITQLTP